jgi:hypothetical protein
MKDKAQAASSSVDVYTTDTHDHVLPAILSIGGARVEPGPRYLKRLRLAQIQRRADIVAYAASQDSVMRVGAKS